MKGSTRPCCSAPSRRAVPPLNVAAVPAPLSRRQMQGGIALAVEHIQSPDQLKAAVKQLYQSHAAAAEGGKAKAAGGGGAEAGAAGSGGAQAGVDEAAQR